MIRATLVATVCALLGMTSHALAADYVVNGNSLDTAALSACGGSWTFYTEIDVALLSTSDAAVVACAQADSSVRSVVEDMVLPMTDPGLAGPEATSITEAASNPPTSGDDDFFFDQQWGHDAIDAPEAWDTGARGAGVRVCVLDSGIDAEHPDLAPNLNAALSASFVPGEDWNVQPGFYFNHGTHVAGTIAAADNAFGVIGVAPEAEIVAIKVLSEFTGSGSFGGIIGAIVYATDIGCDVINMSLGADVPRDIPGVAELFVATGQATQWAYQNDVTVVVAAGNDARDLNHDSSLRSLPAELPGVLSISATAPIGWGLDAGVFLDNLASYSNYGRNAIDFAAPGGDFVYPGDEACEVGGLVRPCWVFDLVFSTISGGWGWAAGTSMATPHAAGVAALVIGNDGGDMSVPSVARALRRGADHPTGFGRTDEYGRGRVNALGSL